MSLGAIQQALPDYRRERIAACLDRSSVVKTDLESDRMPMMETAATWPDERLIDSALAADSELERRRIVDSLFERHYRRVGLWCLRFAGNRETAADLTQEVFMKAYAALNRFRGRSKFTTWLYTITRNHCLNHVRGRNGEHEQPGAEALELKDDSAPHPLETLHLEESLQVVRELMADLLTDLERRALTLHYVEELPLPAVTRILKLDNKSGAKAQIVSAKRKLRRSLQRLQAAGQVRGLEP